MKHVCLVKKNHKNYKVKGKELVSILFALKPLTKKWWLILF
jgi:hypothetical protein